MKQILRDTARSALRAFPAYLIALALMTTIYFILDTIQYGGTPTPGAVVEYTLLFTVLTLPAFIFTIAGVHAAIETTGLRTLVVDPVATQYRREEEAESSR